MLRYIALSTKYVYSMISKSGQKYKKFQNIIENIRKNYGILE